MDDYIDPGAAKVLADAAADVAARDWWELTPAEARDAMATAVALMREPVEIYETSERLIPSASGQVMGRLYRPGPDPAPFLLFIHGGGWEVGSVDIYDAPVRRLANDSGFAVLSIEYRLAPESPYPAALDDCCTALEWAHEHLAELGGDGSFVAVAGDSSGGNLAGALAQRARDEGGPRIDHQLLIYPVVTRDFDSFSYLRYGTGYGLTTKTMRHFWDLYVGEAAPAYSDLYAAGSLSGLPPTTTVTVALDPLCSEGEEYAERLARAGVPSTLIRVHGLIHGSWIQDGVGARSYQLGLDIAGILRRAAAGPT